MYSTVSKSYRLVPYVYDGPTYMYDGPPCLDGPLRLSLSLTGMGIIGMHVYGGQCQLLIRDLLLLYTWVCGDN